MKKLFFLAAAMVAALAMNAEVVYSWEGSVGTTTIAKQESGDGSIVLDSSVKIHNNADAVDAIKFGKGFYTNSQYNYISIKPASGTFKAGDVLKCKAVISHDNTGDNEGKTAQLRVRIVENTDLWNGDAEKVVNGKISADDPIEDSFTLASDADELLAGRVGNTTLYIVSLKVERGGGTAIENTEAEVKTVKTFENGQLIIIKNGVKYNATGAIVK